MTDIAEFEEPVIEIKTEPVVKNETKKEQHQPKPEVKTPIPIIGSPGFHYNIQIHLPATTDISVYNAIFAIIKENLM